MQHVPLYVVVSLVILLQHREVLVVVFVDWAPHIGDVAAAVKASPEAVRPPGIEHVRVTNEQINLFVSHDEE